MDAIRNQSDPSFSVDLKHALVWVARALDYVGVDDIHHNHRVAYIAYECSKQLQWDVKQQEFAFFAGLIHDCGVSQTTEHTELVAKLNPDHVKVHCIAGFQALNSCNLLAKFAPIILHHHTHWQQLEQTELSCFEKDMAALIFIADRLDFFRAECANVKHPDLITLKKHDIIRSLKKNSGSTFRPDYVDALCTLVEKDGFWFAMEPENIEALPLGFSHLDWLQKDLSLHDLVQLGRFIAGIVDAKSPFTYQHSRKVAELCLYLAKGMALTKRTSQMLYVSGLVHDVGKLRTPDEILHKEGPLTSEEYIHIKRHTIDTEIALKMVFPCSKIGEWASNHHEKLNGSGYPYNKTDQDLDLPSRIIAVADIFQALSQNRPYRERLEAKEILEIMWAMVEKGELDHAVFAYLEQNIDECYELSVNENIDNSLLDARHKSSPEPESRLNQDIKV
ncbi:HD-GYP domain-containing protein [Vibrio galatheae]|uniref:HD-GYP domain-containing protein n=1 Tax=Vibrio galatheae TaxID=579748 RepID=UPI0005FA53FF|nr:HD domain-containing phosphohydrolase [Vibrio galatheae]